MIHFFLALLKHIEQKLSTFIKKLESKFKNMKSEVTSDVAGLKKFATLKTLSIDGDGNYNITADVHYEDVDGKQLAYKDADKSTLSTSGKAPDESVPTEQLTPEQIKDQSNINALLVAITPVLSQLMQG